MKLDRLVTGLFYRSIILWVVVSLTPPAAALAREALPGQATDIVCAARDWGAWNILAGFCGDGICDPYMGENAATCPRDCAPTPMRTPISRLAQTPTPTASPTATPTSTDTASPAPAAAVTETLAAQTSPISSGELLPGCGLVSYESRPATWQGAYSSLDLSVAGFVPVRMDDREVYVCRAPPVGQLCIPLYDGLMSAAGWDVERVVLVDCFDTGECWVHTGNSAQAGGSLCFTITWQDNLSCAVGCALAPERASLPGLGDAGFLAPVLCSATLLVVLVVALILFLSRRSRDRHS